ncbi:NlpC/P60 family protein [Alkalicoccus urumqiensis]|uniref:NlpC/P60 domain-containing protein n=1 Tax=Alkalicoccus urumqiensis TaxID=1548213 RepID=A0A2P6MJ57_ALKUR|nr:NlpC/P60 family protein [Alkalicoccus urumqiensis]PRO66290.1 hypothetical protein C6I21_05670 [Alkalicoccus urumqiensis]
MKRSIGILLIVVMTFLGAFAPSAGASSTADEIIAAGERHMGTPYRWGGTTPAGFDCSGFTGYAYKQAGIDLPRSAAQQYQVGTPVAKSDLRRGDLVFFDTRGGPTHNGIYIGNNKMIHSSSSKGVSIASLDNVYWKPRYIGARRIIEEQRSEVASVASESKAPQAASSGLKPIDVSINGAALQSSQTSLKTPAGRTLVPMRSIFEQLGATVTWDGATKQVTGVLGDQTVELMIGSADAKASGKPVRLDQAAELINGNTMVPLRFVSESLGAKVDWDSVNNEVVITR